MTERIPWWRAFLPKKKAGASKDTASPYTFGPDFDPFAQQPQIQKNPSQPGADQTDDASKKSRHGDDTYDDSAMDSVFNEHTCRRNMKVSRSGRFRERNKIRKALPIQDNESEDHR